MDGNFDASHDVFSLKAWSSAQSTKHTTINGRSLFIMQNIELLPKYVRHSLFVSYQVGVGMRLGSAAHVADIVLRLYRQ